MYRFILVLKFGFKNFFGQRKSATNHERKNLKINITKYLVSKCSVNSTTKSYLLYLGLVNLVYTTLEIKFFSPFIGLEV